MTKCYEIVCCDKGLHYQVPGKTTTIPPTTTGQTTTPPCEPIVYEELHVEDVRVEDNMVCWQGGADFEAGIYRVVYLRGAVKYDPLQGWRINSEVRSEERRVGKECRL